MTDSTNAIISTNLIYETQFKSLQEFYSTHGTGFLNLSGSTNVSYHDWKKRELARHPKMKGVEKPYVAALQKDMETAKKLDLRSEGERIERAMLKADIDELTRGAGYVEVTDKDLESMFEFPRLRRKIRWNNFMVGITNFIRAISNNYPFKDKLILRLVKEDVERASIPLIEGALYRLAEAKESGIFDSFRVAYPNVVTERQLERERDPALIGIANGAMFLICSWDLPKDIGRVEADMEALKRLKIK